MHFVWKTGCQSVYFTKILSSKIQTAESLRNKSYDEILTKYRVKLNHNLNEFKIKVDFLHLS